MARVTLNDLKMLINRINEFIKNTGYMIILGQRYGYKAIDLGYSDGRSSIVDTLMSGMTTGETYLYLSGMLASLYIMKKKRRKRR